MAEFFLIEKAQQAWNLAGPYAPIIAGGFFIIFGFFLLYALSKSGIKWFQKYPIRALIREMRAGGTVKLTLTGLRKVTKVSGGQKRNYYQRQDVPDEFPATGLEHVFEAQEGKGSGAFVDLWSPRRGEYHPVEFMPSPKGGWAGRPVVSEEMLQWKLSNDDYIDSQHKTENFWDAIKPFLPILIGIFGLLMLSYANGSFIDHQTQVAASIATSNAQLANATLEIGKQLAYLRGANPVLAP